MKIIQNINNNYAVAIDGNGNRLIVSGKGIGYGRVPRELTDLTLISSSFYGIDDNYLAMMNDLPPDIIDIAALIVNTAKMEISVPLSPNIVLTLADHINFTLRKYRENIKIKLPILNDIAFLFEEEYRIGLKALTLIRRRTGIRLPKAEAGYIALHIVNSEEKEKSTEIIEQEKDIMEITRIVEARCHIRVDTASFNYSRFVSHLQYLFKRGKTKHLIQTDNNVLYQDVAREFPSSAQCANEIGEYFKQRFGVALSEEEKLYLILHINRLCTYEDVTSRAQPHTDG